MLKMMPTVIWVQAMTMVMVTAGMQAMMLPPIPLTARRTGFGMEGGREAQAGGLDTGAKVLDESSGLSDQRGRSHRRESGVPLTPRRSFRIREDRPKAA